MRSGRYNIIRSIRVNVSNIGKETFYLCEQNKTQNHIFPQVFPQVFHNDINLIKQGFMSNS